VNAVNNNYIIAASAGSTLSSKLMLESMGLLGGWAYAVLRTVEL